MTHFDIERDIEIVNAGGFFCKACVVGNPAYAASPDARYCQDCYDCLIKESAIERETTRGKKRKDFYPQDNRPVTTVKNNAKGIESHKKAVTQQNTSKGRYKRK